MLSGCDADERGRHDPNPTLQDIRALWKGAMDQIPQPGTSIPRPRGPFGRSCWLPEKTEAGKVIPWRDDLRASLPPHW
jgi:hypothetical protein